VRDSQLEPGLSLLDLNLARYRSLVVVGRLEKCTMSELAMFTSIDRTTLTRSVDQLLSAGLVERMKDEGDRRLVWITLTPEGEALRRKADAFVSNHGRYLLEGVPEPLQREFIRLQKFLIAKLAPDLQSAQSILDFNGPAGPGAEPEADA
jgi:DNA-binding MarR family transcriptional regulator